MAKQSVATKSEQTTDERITLSLNEPSVNEDFSDASWGRCSLNPDLSRILARVDRALSGACAVSTILQREADHRFDAANHDNVRYSPLNEYILGGLNSALTHLLEESHFTIAGIREMYEPGESDE